MNVDLTPINLSDQFPPVYVAFAMAHGHLEDPFWHHVEVKRYIADAFDKKLTIAELVAQHNKL